MCGAVREMRGCQGLSSPSEKTMTDTPTPAKSIQTSRRDFIRASSMLVASGAVTGSLGIARTAHAQGSDLIKLGLDVQFGQFQLNDNLYLKVTYGF